MISNDGGGSIQKNSRGPGKMKIWLGRRQGEDLVRWLHANIVIEIAVLLASHHYTAAARAHVDPG